MRDIHFLISDRMYTEFKRALKKMDYTTAASFLREQIRALILRAEERKINGERASAYLQEPQSV